MSVRACVREEYRPDETVCGLEVVAPVGTERRLPTHVPNAGLVPAQRMPQRVGGKVGCCNGWLAEREFGNTVDSFRAIISRCIK